MIDFGFDKLALIGAVALIVIGPERLPRVARTVGHLLGKAQRYVSDVKAEVSRSIELEELKKAKGQFEDAARGVQETVSNEIHQTSESLSTGWSDPASDNAAMDGFRPNSYYHKPKKKNWRLKRSAMPQWYKQRHGVRSKAQSGAARVARFRPPRPNP
ncbi:MAG: preprotein translocase [Pseudomonadota bacterium]|jgi:sec-independent protein translocase protein TatB